MGDSEKINKLKSSASLAKRKSRPSAMSRTSFGSSTSHIAVSHKQSEMKRAEGPRYMPTYRLDPKIPFRYGPVSRLLEMIVERECASLTTYDTFTGPKITQYVASEVRAAIRRLNFDRYKVCVVVYMGERKLQGFQAVARCLWDLERDGWATYTFERRSYFVTCVCFCLYHD